MNRIALALALSLWAARVAAGGGLAAQLEALATANGFHVDGIHALGDAAAIPAQGPVPAQLRTLLEGYNHVVEAGPGTTVLRVLILGAKQPARAGFTVPTTRTARHHVVDAALVGTPGRRTRAKLMVDTGASTLVLPASMIPILGFRAEDLPGQPVQTANGRTSGKAATLGSVSVGGATASDVAVLFVADELLGGVSLLGLSFLERFAVTLDDANSRLVLVPR